MIRNIVARFEALRSPIAPSRGTEDGRCLTARATAVEPVPVSPLRDGIANAANDKCTCAECEGENPDCALHGIETAWALTGHFPEDWQGITIEYRDMFKAAEVENRRLRELLRPFAVAGEDLDENDDDRGSVWEHPVAMNVTIGDFKRAAHPFVIEIQPGDKRTTYSWDESPPYYHEILRKLARAALASIPPGSDPTPEMK
jgi:hypothetical protein